MAILKDKPSISLNKSIANVVKETGQSVNTILEAEYADVLAEMRSRKGFEDKSATKLALIDNGIRGNMKVENLFTTDDNKYLFPVYYADLIETAMANNDIMQYLVSSEIEIDASVVEAPTLDMLSDENKSKVKKSRVAEGAEFPIFELTIGEAIARLFKRGVRLNQTYEAARQMRIDLFSKAVSAVTNDIVRQNVQEATKVLENSKLHSLGTTQAANTITNIELLDWIIDYVDRFGYAPTTILAPSGMYKQLFHMMYNSNEMEGISRKVALNFPLVKMENLDIIPANVTAKNGKARLLMYNKDYALTRYVERGSTLQEQARNIFNQTEDIVISEVSGFANFVESTGEIVSV